MDDWQSINQYLVSAASFIAVYILNINSSRLPAFWDSAIFTPIAVPDLKSWLLRTYLFVLSKISVYSIIERDNWKDKSTIKFGFFVRVPFRNKELIGIIWDDSSENIEKSKLKEIIEYYPSFKLSETIIDFIKFFSRYNFTSLGKTLKLFIPQTYLIEDIKTLKKYKIDKKKIGNINITNARQSVLDLFEEPSNLFSSSEIIKTAKVSLSVIKKLIEEEVLISVDLVSQQSLIKVEHKKFNLNT